MSNLLLRLITGTALIGLILWTLFFAPLWIFAAVTAGFILLELDENETPVRAYRRTA